MRIGSVNNSVNFRMKIVQNDDLKDLIHHLQVDRKYSQKKIEGMMNSIKKMADDSYTFEIEKVNPYSGIIWYDISTNNENAAVDERGDICSTRKFFMLRNINKLCSNMIKINKKAGNASEIYDKVGI